MAPCPRPAKDHSRMMTLLQCHLLLQRRSNFHQSSNDLADLRIRLLFYLEAEFYRRGFNEFKTIFAPSSFSFIFCNDRPLVLSAPARMRTKSALIAELRNCRR